MNPTSIVLLADWKGIPSAMSREKINSTNAETVNPMMDKAFGIEAGPRGAEIHRTFSPNNLL